MMAILFAFTCRAQTFTNILNDGTGDGESAPLLDATAFDYAYDAGSDSISFRLTCANISATNAGAFGVNVLVSIPGYGSSFKFWTKNTTNSYSRLLTVWVAGTAPSSYTGTIGIGDSTGIKTSTYNNLSSNNIAINLNKDAKTIILKLKRSDLIPDAYFNNNKVTIGIAAVVGSNDAWNDDVFSSPNASITLDKGTTGIAGMESRNTVVAAYPNPANNQITIEGSIINPSAKIKVYSMEGKEVSVSKVSSGNVARINTSSLNSGIYFFSICNAAGQIEKGKFAVSK